MSEITTTRRSARISLKENVQSKENVENGSHVTKIKSTRKRSTVTTVIQENDETEPPKHSPPKQRKPITTKGSPTRLFERLSLDEPAAVQKNVSKYASAKKVLSGNDTWNLPGRENELAELSKFLDNCLAERKSASIYISGPPGTGKTSCVNKLLIESYANKFNEISINCTGIATIGNIYKKICEQLKLKSGTEKENLNIVTEYITRKNQKKMVLLLLDEIDQLVGNKQSVLYSIFEWPALKNSKIVLIGIANALDLTDRLLTRLNTNIELKPKLLHFPSYTKEQIVGIFKSRLEDAGAMEIFAPNTIQFLAAKVSAVSGDIRRALDIGRRVIEIAANKTDGQNVDLTDLGVEYLDKPEEKIKLQDVLSVLNGTYGSTSRTFDDENTQFPLQQKIIVGALLVILKNDKNKDITIGRSYAVYSKICTKRNIAKLDQSEFAGVCALIEDRGMIKLTKNKEPKLRKIQLQWDESEVMSALQDKQLIASILADTSVLGR